MCEIRQSTLGVARAMQVASDAGYIKVPGLRVGWHSIR